MSWSFSAVGSPAKVKEHMEKAYANAIGKNKVEFDEAKPHLTALIDANAPSEGSQMLLKVEACGSAYWDGDKKLSGSCSCEIKQVHGFVGA